MAKSVKSLMDNYQCEFDILCNKAFNALETELRSHVGSRLINSIVAIEPKLVDVYLCLKKSELDPDIRAIKLASLFGTTSAVIANKLPTNMPYLGQFCAFYYTSLYQTYINQRIGINGSSKTLDDLNMKYSIKRERVYDHFAKNFKNLTRSLQSLIVAKADFYALYDIIMFLDFMKRKYSYQKANNAMTDFLVSYSSWVNDKFISGAEGQLAPIYGKEYNRGCNCICGTVAIATMLRLLSSRGRISTDPDSFLLVDDQTNIDGCHIFLRWKDINFETTDDALILKDDTDLGHIKHFMDILRISVSIQSDLELNGAYKILPGSDMENVIIANHVGHNPLTFKFWHNIGLLDEDSHDMTVIQMQEISMTELFYRIHRLLVRFSRSIHLIDIIISRLQNLWSVGGLGAQVQREWDIYPRPVYKKLNAVQNGKKLMDELVALSGKYKDNKELHAAAAAFKAVFSS